MFPLPFRKRPERRKILFFSFHYPPDQSAGAIRTRALVHELIRQNPMVEVTVFCSVPRRYGRSFAATDGGIDGDPRIRIRRFWIPFLGQGPFPAVVSYGFYFVQSVPAALWLRPEIVVGTSAKLLTSFVAACAAKLTKARLFIDFRDTFSDNFFYFYRWHKRILLQSLILVIENLVLRAASSINMVSIGFQEAFVGWDRILAKYSISLTNFPNGIERQFRHRIAQATARHMSHDSYTVVYAGNLGEGQDILGLLKDLARQPDLQRQMQEQNIRFHIYGSGAQAKAIQLLTQEGDEASPRGILAGMVRYCGLLPREEVEQIYASADCLMLQLGLYSSLTMVIPTKIFEYAATPYPILYGASGFTSSFIEQINGSLHFRQCDASSFLEVIEKSQSTQVDSAQRNQFLDRYDAQSIYREYSRHILGGRKAPVPFSATSLAQTVPLPWTGLNEPLAQE